LDIGVLGYIGIVQHKEHSPEVLSIPPGAPCIYMLCIFCLVNQLYKMHGTYITIGISHYDSPSRQLFHII